MECDENATATNHLTAQETVGGIAAEGQGLGMVLALPSDPLWR